MSAKFVSDPCDGWPYAPAWMARGYHYPADRGDALSIEDFPLRPAPPIFAKFLPYVRTDFQHWSYGLDWSLESGPDEAPALTEIYVPYNYRGRTPDSWTQPGDPAEVETGVPWFLDETGARCEVTLTEAEQGRVEAHIYENPPCEDYYDDY